METHDDTQIKSGERFAHIPVLGAACLIKSGRECTGTAL